MIPNIEIKEHSQPGASTGAILNLEGPTGFLGGVSVDVEKQGENAVISFYGEDFACNDNLCSTEPESCPMDCPENQDKTYYCEEYEVIPQARGRDSYACTGRVIEMTPALEKQGASFLVEPEGFMIITQPASKQYSFVAHGGTGYEVFVRETGSQAFRPESGLRSEQDQGASVIELDMRDQRVWSAADILIVFDEETKILSRHLGNPPKTELLGTTIQTPSNTCEGCREGRVCYEVGATVQAGELCRSDGSIGSQARTGAPCGADADCVSGTCYESLCVPPCTGCRVDAETCLEPGQTTSEKLCDFNAELVNLKPSNDPCTRDIECASKTCGDGLCRQRCNGCYTENYRCVAQTDRTEDEYCSSDGLQPLKAEGDTCNASYQCGSNLCNSVCKPDTYWNRFLAWFA